MRIRRIANQNQLDEPMDVDPPIANPPPIYDYFEEMINAGLAFDEDMRSIQFKSAPDADELASIYH